MAKQNTKMNQSNWKEDLEKTLKRTEAYKKQQNH